jgi:coniferyl-aldehyde dehydrogenase
MAHIYLTKIKKIYASNADATIAKGAKVFYSKNTSVETTSVISPIILTQVTPEMALSKEEIFGPILPIVTIANTQSAIDLINQKPHPLAN